MDIVVAYAAARLTRDRQIGWRKIPTAADRNEAHAEAENRARDRRRGRRPVQQVPGDDNSGAGERGERVQVRAQHDRDLIDQQVAQDASADAGQHPEQRGDKRIDPERQRLLRAGHSEQAKSRRIEQQHDWTESSDVPVPQERHATCCQRNRDVAPVFDRRRRDRPNQQIPSHAAGVAGDERQHAHTEQDPVYSSRRMPRR